MSIPQPGTHTIGAEIPYRRSAMDKRTGSLVFDRHLDQKLARQEPAADRLKRG
jgi:hypothetical protein